MKVTGAATSGQQLSRVALLYLLAGFSGCVLLLLAYIPFWVPMISSMTIVWRLLIFSGRLSYPPFWLKLLLVLLSGAGLFLQYGYGVCLEAFVSLLLLGFSLKLLEVAYRRDAILLLYLAFFVLMTFFIFQQSMGAALLVFLHAVILLAALVSVYASEARLLAHHWQPLKTALALFLWALPVMFFMFIVMPRFAPLWRMPLQKQHAQTGMSDTMRPGDISNLTASADLVFRAHFSANVPAKSSLYWYGLILDRFDGVQWRVACQDCTADWQRTDTLPVARASGESAYQVILEPQNGSWLYVLPHSQLRDAQIAMHKAQGIFRYASNVTERIAYDAWTGSAPVVAVLSDDARQNNVQLPDVGNSQARALAQQWRQRAGNQDERVVQSALQYYNAHAIYTLQPPTLGEDRVDDFLFVTHRGFCEHFASSFVFLMRAAGIPARVVIGYMGGEVHADEQYVTVRQYDAHAWAEVWLPDRGWVMVDPTAAVAPERIDNGFEKIFANSPAFSGALNMHAYRNNALLNALRLQLEKSEYLWARWVLGYEGDVQLQVLQKWGLLSPWRMALWMTGGVVGAFIVLLIFLQMRDRLQNSESPATRRYRFVSGQYAVFGVVRHVTETPLQFAQRILEAELPFAQAFLSVSQLYYWMNYNDESAASNVARYHRESVRLYWRLLLVVVWRRITFWSDQGLRK